MAFQPKLARTYTLAVVNYGVTRGSLEGSDDPESYRRDMVKWANQASQAADKLAESAAPVDGASLRMWRTEAAYWSDLADKHKVAK